MAKNTTPFFVVTRRIITDNRGYDKLNKIMRITERMYNAGVRHCIKQLNELKKDVWFELPHPTDVGWGFHGLAPVKPR